MGITPKCPYGVHACWPNVQAALGQLAEVEKVLSREADAYNCTARIRLKSNALPDVGKLRQEFRAIVGDNYVFRGVEVTLDGTAEWKDGKLVFASQKAGDTLELKPLTGKLQWNYHKRKPRGPEPEESVALEQLIVETKSRDGQRLQVRVTGPLDENNAGVQVREYFSLEAAGKAR